MRVGIIGTGAWGTALASVCTDAGHSVIMLAHEAEVADEINSSHTNERFLPSAKLDAGVRAASDARALEACELIICATPTQFIRPALRDVLRNAPGQLFTQSIPFVNVAKGIEKRTHLRVSQIVREEAPYITSYAVLSGPSHAEEVIQRMPTTVVCASDDHAVAACVQQELSTERFRIYSSTDVIGVEVCGSLKNVIAIAAGIVDGVGLGDNTKAALITRGLAEIARLGTALGADAQTFYGLAGMGDLIVTCSSPHSRNRFVGEQIGKGRSIADITAEMSAVAEGVSTTMAALELADEAGVELPITRKVADILFEGEDPIHAIRTLMLRPARVE